MTQTGCMPLYEMVSLPEHARSQEGQGSSHSLAVGRFADSMLNIFLDSARHHGLLEQFPGANSQSLISCQATTVL